MDRRLYIVACLLLHIQLLNAADIVSVPDSSRTYSWVISERLGTPTRVPFDSISLNYQNSTLPEGNSASKAFLGNIGSPMYDRIFDNRQENPNFLFMNVFEEYIPVPEKKHYSNAKTAITNVSYQTAGGIQTREERFKALITLNANKAFNFGGKFDYIYARGFYANQAVRKLDYQLFSSYVSDRYVMHAFINPFNLHNFENGGITDDLYITDPKAVEGKNPVETNNIPTVLGADVLNKNSGGVYYLNHRYNLGFYKEIERDSASAVNDSLPTEEFVPVSTISHTAKVTTFSRNFTANALPENYFPNYAFSRDTTDDKTNYFSFQNTVALSLREGFNKYAKAGLTAFATFDIRSYEIMNSEAKLDRIGESVASIGAEIARREGELLNYNAFGELGVVGKEAGQFRVEGNVRLKVPFKKEIMTVDLHGSVKNLLPNFYYRSYHSNHYWWDNDLNFEKRVKLRGTIAFDRLKMGLKVSVENLSNYIYLDSIDAANPLGVKQHEASLQVFTATLYKNFAFKAWHWDNQVTYQKSSNKEIIPLPELTAYSNMYVLTKISKVLTMQFGVDCRFFTKYNALGYNPALGQYHIQREMEVGSYPLVNAYINMQLKQARFFVMYYNAGAGLISSDYFHMPHYPMNPTVLKLGVSVNFFN